MNSYIKMTSLKNIFKEEFNENIKEDYIFLIINRDDVSYNNH